MCARALDGVNACAMLAGARGRSHAGGMDDDVMEVPGPAGGGAALPRKRGRDGDVVDASGGGGGGGASHQRAARDPPIPVTLASVRQLLRAIETAADEQARVQRGGGARAARVLLTAARAARAHVPEARVCGRH